jgi:hypothetical protein
MVRRNEREGRLALCSCTARPGAPAGSLLASRKDQRSRSAVRKRNRPQTTRLSLRLRRVEHRGHALSSSAVALELHRLRSDRQRCAHSTRAVVPHDLRSRHSEELAAGSVRGGAASAVAVWKWRQESPSGAQFAVNPVPCSARSESGQYLARREIRYASVFASKESPDSRSLWSCSVVGVCERDNSSSCDAVARSDLPILFQFQFAPLGDTYF